MEEFKERLVSFIRNYAGTSIRKFEETCGLTNGTIGAIKEQGPTASVLSRIADAYPELSMDWLFRGTGEMLVGHEEVTSAISMQNVQAVFITNWSDIRGVVEDAVKKSLKSQ